MVGNLGTGTNTSTLIMQNCKYFIAAIAGALCFLATEHAATAEQSVCDTKVLNRPGCEVGDFGPPENFKPNYQIYTQQNPFDKLHQPPKPEKQQQKQSKLDSHDETAEMRIAWDEWHKRVAGAVYERYSTLANAAFPLYQGKPLRAVAAYTVTRDSRIINVHLIEKNENKMFNAIVLTAISSLNGNNAVLQFPAGSSPEQVEKSATFTQNMPVIMSQ